MKHIALTLTALCASLALARADDVALLSFRVGENKQLRQVAIEFHEQDAPAHVQNFKKLAKKGFYKGMAIHRVFPHTLVQMGDPLSKKKDRTKVGTGGPGFTLPAEIRRKHTKGAIAAARLPDKLNPSRLSNGSQFYVCLTPMPNLDGQYTVFANVLYGMDTLDYFSARSVDSNDYPLERIEIRSVKILPRAELPPPPAPFKPGTPVKKKSWWQIF